MPTKPMDHINVSPTDEVQAAVEVSRSDEPAPKKLRAVSAQRLREKLTKLRSSLAAVQSPKNSGLHDPVPGRTDLGKRVAEGIKALGGDGPGRWRLGLDMSADEKDLPPTGIRAVKSGSLTVSPARR